MNPAQKTNLRRIWKISRTLWLAIAGIFLLWHNSLPVHADNCVTCTNVTVDGQTFPGCKGIQGGGATACAFVGGECAPVGTCAPALESD
jgi:hypothetical protein